MSIRVHPWLRILQEFEANHPKKTPLLHEGYLPLQEAANERDKTMNTLMQPTVPKTAQDLLSRGLILAATVLFGLGTSFCLAQPANDMFANRILLTGTNIVATGSNVGATKEPGEPNHAGDTGGASVWWEWTAHSIGTVTISTTGSSFDTVLGVYIGSSVSALTMIADNDDAPDGQDYTSKVAFTVTPDQTYQIAVDGYGADSGSLQLQVIVGPLPVPQQVIAWGDN